MGGVDLASMMQVLADAGVHLRSPRVLAAGRSVVLADGSLVVRISPERSSLEEQHLHVARLLAASGAPVLEPLSPQVVPCLIGSVTLWPRAERPRDPEGALGVLLRRLHAAAPTLLPVQGFPRERLFLQLSTLAQRGVPGDVVAALGVLAEGLSPRPGWSDDRSSVVHGDAHRGNVLVFGGRPVLIDVGSAHHGPWQVDMVPTWCACRRNGGDWGPWFRLKDAYEDPRLEQGLWDWPFLDEAVLEWELVTTVFLAEQWNLHPWVRQEVADRLGSWGRPGDGVWNTGLAAP